MLTEHISSQKPSPQLETLEEKWSAEIIWMRRTVNRSWTFTKFWRWSQFDIDWKYLRTNNFLIRSRFLTVSCTALKQNRQKNWKIHVQLLYCDSNDVVRLLFPNKNPDFFRKLSKLIFSRLAMRIVGFLYTLPSKKLSFFIVSLYVFA